VGLSKLSAFSKTMSLDQPDSLNFDGSDLRFGLIAARFNLRMVDAMLENCVNVWEQAGVAPSNVELQRVPGSNELPYAAAMLAKTLQFDAIVVLGLVLAGETPHHEVIADSTGQSLQRIGLDTEVPVINGIVVVHTEAQAEARALGEINRGREFGLAALEMGLLKRQLSERLDKLESEQGPASGEKWDGLSKKGNPWKL
jgi:6,7-dimethyl-8-ribityllumazine synthase|tara:strand:- start:933 stop:1529 length:597 start_codon:yes stop_codon:yes gene_type:complete